MSHRRRSDRRLVAVVALLCLLTAGGCRFLCDEFMRLDRAGPVTDDPRVVGGLERP